MFFQKTKLGKLADKVGNSFKAQKELYDITEKLILKNDNITISDCNEWKEFTLNIISNNLELCPLFLYLFGIIFDGEIDDIFIDNVGCDKKFAKKLEMLFEIYINDNNLQE